MKRYIHIRKYIHVIITIIIISLTPVSMSNDIIGGVPHYQFTYKYLINYHVNDKIDFQYYILFCLVARLQRINLLILIENNEAVRNDKNIRMLFCTVTL